MEALFVAGDIGGKFENNTSQYRIYGPAKYLERAGHSIALATGHGASRPHEELGTLVEVDPFDYGQVRETVLFERNIFPERVDLLRAAGAKRIIVTFDDHYGLLPASSRSKPFWERNYARFLRALHMVDLVIVPNMRLVKFFGAYAKKIEYLPNYLDPELWPEPKPDRAKIVGWGGSAQHQETWSNNNLQIAIRNFLKDHPDWRFRCYGLVPADWMRRHGQIEIRPFVPFLDWPGEVNEFEIGLAPLYGEYDRHRSNLKVLEYQRLGIPWLASHETPYVNPVRFSGGVLVRNAWLDELYALAGNPNRRRSLGDLGLAESDGYLMSGHTADYERVLWG